VCFFFTSTSTHLSRQFAAQKKGDPKVAFSD
jgi:hypothetical protein